MRRRVTIERLDLRVRGQVDDPRALARAIAAAVADRLADATGSSGALNTSAGGARHVETIDAGAFSPREAPAAAAEATLAAVIARAAEGRANSTKGESEGGR